MLSIQYGLSLKNRIRTEFAKLARCALLGVSYGSGSTKLEVSIRSPLIPPIADIRADIAFRRSGPKGDIGPLSRQRPFPFGQCLRNFAGAFDEAFDKRSSSSVWSGVVVICKHFGYRPQIIGRW